MATARSHTARNVGRRNDPALADRGRRAPDSFEETAPNTGELNTRTTRLSREPSGAKLSIGVGPSGGPGRRAADPRQCPGRPEGPPC